MARLASTTPLILSILLIAMDPFGAVAFQDPDPTKGFAGTALDRADQFYSATMHIKSGEGFVAVGKYDSALYHLFAAVKTLEKGDSSILLGRAYSALGRVFYKLRDPARALVYYAKAEELIAQHASCIDLSELYIDMGLASVDEDKIDRSFDFFGKGRSLCTRRCDNFLLMRLSFAEGTALLKKGDVKQALARLDSALVIAQNLGDKSASAEILVRLSAVHYEAEESKKANDLLTEAEILACGLELNDVLVEVYRQQALLMLRRGDLQSQAEYQAKFIELSEQLYNEQIMARLAELEINFNERENIKVIEQQKQALALSNITLEKKKRLIFLGVVCVVLGTIVAIMLVRAVRRKKVTINNLVGEVEDATTMLEDRIWQEQNEVTSKDIELRSALQKMKADVASLLGICMVASKHSRDEGTKEGFEQVHRDLTALKRRMERL